MHILKLLFESLKHRLKTEIPSVKIIDLYFGQDELPEDTDPLPKPAILIEFLPFKYTTLGNRKRSVDNLQFNVHIISDVVQEASSIESPTVVTKAHEHLSLLTAVDEALIAYMGQTYPTAEGQPLYGSIVANGLEPYKPYGMQLKHIHQYNTRITNVDGAKQFSIVSPTLDLKIPPFEE
jgi:hypothetical protein